MKLYEHGLRSKVALLLLLLMVAAFPAQLTLAWERVVQRPCTDCHAPNLAPVRAGATLDRTACFNCHSPRLPPPKELPLTGEKAHDAHKGYKAGTGPGDALRHPSPDEASAMGKDVGKCLLCHSVAPCMACHAVGIPHVDQRVDCQACHGSLPRIIPPHFPSLPAESAHSEGGLGCFTCHNERDRSLFNLATGEAVEDSVKLCWQCHFEYYYALKEGRHGVAEKKCADTACHDPHNPYLAPPPPEGVGVAAGARLILALALAAGAVAVLVVVWRIRKGGAQA